MRERVLIVAGLIFLAALMALSFVGMPWNPSALNMENERVADALFNDFAFSMIVIALLLAVAMVGGVFLSRREDEK